MIIKTDNLVKIYNERHVVDGVSIEVEQGYIKSILIKEAKEVIGAWAHKYGLLQNLVNKDNSKSIEYMSRILGAVFLPEHINTNGHIWKPFYIIGKGGY